MTELRQRLANLTGNSLFAQAIRNGAEIDLLDDFEDKIS